jgi:hypothetical protein
MLRADDNEILTRVPIDDVNCWRYFLAPRARPNPRGLGGASLFSVAPFTTPISGGRTNGIVPRYYRSIRGAEKILEPGEDWRLLGTEADPVV